jgi:radical SAM protein with 4Fe4S-binding SPASM domain
MNSTHRFIDGVYLVTGASRGAILDTNTGLVYSVNRQACEVCTYQLEDDLFWHTLTSMGLAEPGEPARQQDLPRSHDRNRLKFIWFEIATNECNQRCIHCYSDSKPKLHRMEKRRPEIHYNDLNPAVILKKDRMAYRSWLKAIAQGHALGCKACQFIGGEPLLYKGEDGKTVFDLAVFARQVGYTSIEIFTNATLLTPDMVRMMKDLGVKVAISLYSDDPAVHDRITQTPGSYAKTMNSLLLLKDFGVETRVETILMKANQDTIETTLALRQALGFKGRKPDPLRPYGRGANKNTQSEDRNLIKYGFTLRPGFNASKEKIARNRAGHPCLQGKIAITELGDILPCVFAREHILGNYLDQNSLIEITNAPILQRIWHTTKDDVLVCQDCEYRYVCFDCRPLAEAAAPGRAGFYNAPYPRCTYDPYAGKWGDGIWSVDEKGEPYFDQSLASEITQVRRSFNDQRITR